MRLLNTATLMLEEFFDKKPPYAILSHTWGSEEVAFADLQGERSLLEDKSGYKKVKGCCAMARNDDFDWVWIHTCCIDKTSSAELSEAINSMFQWYQEAVICYAYLIDVPHLKYAIFLAHENLRNSNQEMASVFDKEKTMFTGSRWFSRGWTLQELLAPRNIVFFATDWSCIGTKEELAELIEKSTGITRLALQSESFQGFPARTKMQWASGRETTRVEDLAYCLLGLFDINMPLLYGEGYKAFRRLQEEILKVTEDYSLLTWASKHENKSDSEDGPAFAKDPSDFGDIYINHRYEVLGKDEKKLLVAPQRHTSAGPELALDNIIMDTEHFILRKQRREGIVLEPPMMSPRGIHITLFVNASSGDETVQCGWHAWNISRILLDGGGNSIQNECLAWTLSSIHLDGEAYGVCIGLKEEGNSIGADIKAARKSSDVLYLVPRAMLRKFKPMTLYLRAVPIPANRYWKKTDTVQRPIANGGPEISFSKRNSATPRIADTCPRLMLERFGNAYNIGITESVAGLAAFRAFDPLWAFFVLVDLSGKGARKSDFVVLLGNQRLDTANTAESWHCDVLVPVTSDGPETIEGILEGQQCPRDEILQRPSALRVFPWGEVGARVTPNPSGNTTAEVTIRLSGVETYNEHSDPEYEREENLEHGMIVPTIEIDSSALVP